MKVYDFKSVWQRLLLGGLLFSGWLSASKPPLTEAQRAERLVKAQIAYDKHCAARLAYKQIYIPGQHWKEIEELRRLNDRLEALAEKGNLSFDYLLREGIVEYSHEPVTDKTAAAQLMPYRMLLLRHAYTAAAIPTAKRLADINPDLYDGLIIALPGIGFDVSTLRSLFEITGTFNNGKNNGLWLPDKTRKLRMISIPMDAPLNGMAEKAPYGFGHPDGVMEVLRHAILVFQAMFPGKDTFIIGRSQGGLNAFEAAARLRGIAGVVPLNSSNPDPFIVQECIRRHEEMAKPENVEEAENAGFSCNFHELSWLAHEHYTSLYRMLELPSVVPSLHLKGSKDWSYPEEYMKAWADWEAQNPRLRRSRVFEGPHNLWTRPRGTGEELFQEVLRAMTDFFVEVLGL